ncbi:MAG: hypothetical protein ACOWWM_01375 [Desulfobacterales bacterium]
MRRAGYIHRWYGCIGILAAVMLLVAGCSSLAGTRTGADSDTAAAATPSPTVYHDFNDVLLPSELKVDADRTYIVQGSGMSIGVLTLKGWVERDSLIQFFRVGMERDNWQIMTSFKSPKKTTGSILVFSKENRMAVITIREGLIYTSVEIAVSPIAGSPAAGAFKESTM